MSLLRKSDWNKFDDGVPKDVIREIEALKFLKGNPNIIELKNVYIDEDAIVIVTEYCAMMLTDIMKHFI